MSKYTSIIKGLAPRKFTFTFSSLQNPFQDPRFKIKMVSKVLSPQEKVHIQEVVDSTLEMLEGTKKQSPWVDARLANSIDQFRETLSENELSLRIKRSKRDQMVSNGSFEVKGIRYPIQDLYMHNLKVERTNDIVHCQFRDTDPDLEKKKRLEEVKQYSNSLRTNTLRSLASSNKMEQQVQKYREFKDKVLPNSLYNKFRHSLSGYSLTIEQILIDVEYQLIQGSNLKQSNSLSLRTKWVYEMEQKTAHSVRKNPRRFLFDLEDWHRGFLVPVYQFIPNN